MCKIYDITKDNSILSTLYAKKLNDNDYDGALSIVRRLDNQKVDRESVYYYYAKTYYSAKLYQESINYWFSFLSVCSKKSMAIAYNGLGACFFNLGDVNKAGYYFNLQMSYKPKDIYPYDDVLKEFYQEVTDVKKVYTLAYPYEKADFTPLLDKCYELTKVGKYEEVIKELQIIPKSSKFYGQACMQKAICYIFLEDKQNAVENALIAVELEPKNVNALCNAISILNACDMPNIAKSYVEDLKKISVDISDDDAVKAIMILCDFGDYEFAKKIAYSYLKRVKFDVHVFFTLAIIEYNLSNFEKARELFLKNYRATTSLVSKYYANLCEDAIKKQLANKRVKKLQLNYDLPDDEKFKILEKLAKISTKKVKKLTDELKEICEYCFYSASEKMSFLAISILFDIKCKKSEEFLRQKLLSINVYDVFKRAIISCFILDAYVGELSVVLNGKFKKLKLEKVDFYGDNASIFTSAYAYLVSEACAITDDLTKLKDAAYEVYGALVFSGSDGQIDDYKALAAVMFEASNLIKKISKKELALYFNTTTKKIKKVRDLYSVAFKEEPLIEENTKKIIEEIYAEE